MCTSDTGGCELVILGCELVILGCELVILGDVN